MSGLIGQIGSKSGVLSGSVEFSINTTNYPNATLGLPRKLGSGICRIRFATWIGTFATATSLGTSRDKPGGGGTQAAGLIHGGYNLLTSSEEWNGSSWSAGGSLSTGRHGHGACGSQTAGLAVTGYDSPNTSTEEYNGTSWSSGGSIGTAKIKASAGGTQTAAFCVGSDSGSQASWAITESYDGSSWTVENSGLTGRAGPCSAGTSAAGITVGGEAGATKYDTTEEFDGTSWAYGGTLIGGGRYLGTLAGTQTATVVMHGDPASAYAEEYDGTSWTVQGAAISGNYGGGGAGTSTAAFVTGGASHYQYTKSADGFFNAVAI